MALTAKQAAFVREYLIDLNATQAAIRAGYSAKTANVDQRLTQEEGLEQAEAVSWNGMYLLAVNGHVYLLDGRQNRGYVLRRFRWQWKRRSEDVSGDGQGAGGERHIRRRGD